MSIRNYYRSPRQIKIDQAWDLAGLARQDGENLLKLIAKWETKKKMAVNKLAKLEKRKKRSESRMARHAVKNNPAEFILEHRKEE